ncbi:hypothetical protein DACRYDRAFT_24076 [Dacryopinax primogenitus]|uniref:Uncharacterized protein n=1 Tax=Dacryopinax primogenitus (strain DJM 731) TaxID=1858805 RepID=M5FU06_DACPD|nr:uncharacterized protein DACRYDRAFT_24076 [Dacryopinax primogenitus]EJT98969.1 hypothetical protein DACRYDRAFT_24076 [Dacryopinax primogenitus]
MKFSTLFVLAPLLAAQVHAFAIPQVNARAVAAPASKGKTVTAAGKGTGKGGANNGAGKGAASSTSDAAAASTSVASDNAGSNNAAVCGNDPQTSLCLLASQVQPGLEQDGQETPEAGQVPSLTSSNNFINFCATMPNVPLTNGQQIKTGSCNPTPMGAIISQDNMPSSKFQFPKNLDVIQSNTAFTISMAINNLVTGNFVSATQNYFGAPSQVNSQGIQFGHSHVVIEAIDSISSTTVTKPAVFAFFKGLNAPAQNGILTAEVTGGLPAGTYKLSSINSASNHQPVLVAVAQHGDLDDTVYFTVSDNPGDVTAGNGATGNAGAGNGASGNAGAGASSSSVDTNTSTSAAAAAATTTVAAGKGSNNASTGSKGAKGGNNNKNTTTSAAATTTTAKSGAKTQIAAGGSKSSKTTSSAAEKTTTAESSAKTQIAAGGSKSSKTTSSAAAAATTKKSSAGGAAGGKGQTTVAEPPCQ